MNMREKSSRKYKIYVKSFLKKDFSRYEQALIMANFIEKVANSIYENNTAENLLEDLDKLREDF